MNLIQRAILAVENRVHAALVRHGIAALRITVGAVFLGFGVLKYFPGVSPAEGLAAKTTELLTFGLVPWRVILVAAGMVIAAGTFRGGRLVRDEPQPDDATQPREAARPADAAPQVTRPDRRHAA